MSFHSVYLSEDIGIGGRQCLIRRTLSMKVIGFLFSCNMVLCWYPIARAAATGNGLYRFTLIIGDDRLPFFNNDWRASLVWLPPKTSTLSSPSTVRLAGFTCSVVNIPTRITSWPQSCSMKDSVSEPTWPCSRRRVCRVGCGAHKLLTWTSKVPEKWKNTTMLLLHFIACVISVDPNQLTNFCSLIGIFTVSNFVNNNLSNQTDSADRYQMAQMRWLYIHKYFFAHN